MRLETTRKSLVTQATMVELVLDDDPDRDVQRINLPCRAVAVEDRVGDGRKVTIEIYESTSFPVIQIEDRG